MKRITSFVLVLVLLACFTGCGRDFNIETDGDGTPAADNTIDNDTAPEKEAESVEYAKPYDPSLCTEWMANCEEYITLWKSPDGNEEILKISKGETVTLLGWDEKYAEVSYNGETGYVRSDYIKPCEEDFFSKCLDVVVPTDMYTYDRMMSDIAILKERYPNLVETEILGQSELGRDIPVIRIGSKDAEQHIVFQGAIHGREHMTAWCLMAMADYWLDNGTEIFDNICWHLIPMTNPVGVAVSQTGELTDEQLEIYDSDLAIGIFPEETDEYTKMWKSNGKGTDINRNFPAGWEYVNDFTVPSSAFFKGEEPFSAVEAQILRDYTESYDFDVTVSYHSSGSIIYWQYGDKQPVNDLSYELGEAVNAVTGYPLIGSDGVDGAGYKDWAINSLEIPSITVEIGCGDSPLNERELYSIFARNYMV